MDKRLWAARYFKTHVLAALACELGRIQSDGQGPSLRTTFGLDGGGDKGRTSSEFFKIDFTL
jgi:hypothetical protein